MIIYMWIWMKPIVKIDELNKKCTVLDFVGSIEKGENVIETWTICDSKSLQYLVKEGNITTTKRVCLDTTVKFDVLTVLTDLSKQAGNFFNWWKSGGCSNSAIRQVRVILFFVVVSNKTPYVPILITMTTITKYDLTS